MSDELRHFAPVNFGEIKAQQQAWDEFAPEYYQVEQDSTIAYVPQVLAYLQRAQLLPAAAVPLLDLGGGTGRFALPLAASGVKVHVVDFSAAMLAILAKRWQKARQVGQRKQTAQSKWDAATEHGKQTGPTERVTAANILAAARSTETQPAERLTWEQASWQKLVQQRVRYPVVFVSMLPELSVMSLRQVSMLATQRLLVLRLTQAEDELLTPLLRQLALPPERPEVDPHCLDQYQRGLTADFAKIQQVHFDFVSEEKLTESELLAYLHDYPEMTRDKLAQAQQVLAPHINAGELSLQQHYRFSLLVAQRHC
ncbi:methyltransferase domain-containing protein [Lapidilactobacillus luobeiensis]|uniref:methyltransferase domain-containing protein n=1 Tax=Lapidilactobacillus luobeiensis TaxID=2950371 RepID=UPI0021C35818|nr:class I SAM-dependent methyltransferase [Lapidilactobacillus luobeiensis]